MSQTTRRLPGGPTTLSVHRERVATLMSDKKASAPAQTTVIEIPPNTFHSLPKSARTANVFGAKGI